MMFIKKKVYDSKRQTQMSIISNSLSEDGEMYKRKNNSNKSHKEVLTGNIPLELAHELVFETHQEYKNEVLMVDWYEQLNASKDTRTQKIGFKTNVNVETMNSQLNKWLKTNYEEIYLELETMFYKNLTKKEIENEFQLVVFGTFELNKIDFIYYYHENKWLVVCSKGKFVLLAYKQTDLQATKINRGAWNMVTKYLMSMGQKSITQKEIDKWFNDIEGKGFSVTKK